jgi:hypothetical protein
MARYMVEANRTAGTAVTLGTVGADATRPRRGKWYDVMIGSEAAPADNAFLWTVTRCTALGTSTSVTPSPIDPADAATESDAGENHTVEPTYTAGAVMLSIPLNQRSTFRWMAAFPGAEIVYPATAANGFGIRTPTASAVAITSTVFYEEQ